MKTNTKDDNAVRAEGTDTNPRKLYQVTVARVDYHYTIVLVEAESEKEAQPKAKRLADGQETIWHIADRECFVNGCNEVKEGGCHV